MTPIFRRRVFSDERIQVRRSPLDPFIRNPKCPLSWVLALPPGKTVTFTNYVLGFKAEATDRELEIIQANNLFTQAFITIHSGDLPISFALALGPDWVAEINPDQTQLLRVESQIRAACITWTHFFESIADSDEAS